MPILLSPRSRFRVVLDSDAGAAPEPAFWFRAVDCATSADIADQYDNARLKEMRGGDVQRELLNLLQKHLVDWQGMVDQEGEPIAFGSKPLDKLIVMTEAWELLGKFMAGQRPDGNEKKS